MENQQQQDNSPPNDGSRSNNDDGRNATAGNTENSDNNVPRSNVTVRIQYQYFTPQGLADASNGTVDPAATQDGGNGSQAHVQGSNTLPLPAGVNGLPAAMPFGNAVDSPDLILSFQDVPLTSPDRLNSFITIAAELAMRRFQNMLNRPKGITNEAFKELPVIKIEELPDKTETTCSICYDKFVDEPEDTAENSKKRKHESNSNEDSMDDITGEGKIPRTGSNTPSSLMAATGISDNNNERTTISSILNPQSESDSSQSHESTHNAFIENTEGQDQAQATQEQNPEYLHSPVKIPCGHIFGRSCLYEWTRLENSCPLCRKKIAEQTEEEEQRENNENTSNMEAFEAIRRMLYNTTGQGNATEGQNNNNPNEANGQVGVNSDATSDGAANQNNISQATENSTQGGVNLQTGELNDANSTNSTTNSPNNNNVTVSRTSIIFLRPMNPGEAPQGSQNVNTQALGNSIPFPPSPGLGTTDPAQNANGAQPPRPLTFRTPMQIQWLPITFINPGLANGEQGPPEQNSRLRSLFDQIFSTSGSAGTVDDAPNSRSNSSSENNDASGSSTAGSNEVDQSTANPDRVTSPRRSFFNAMSRFADRLRPSGRSNANQAFTGSSNAEHANDNQSGNGTSVSRLRDTIARALKERRQRQETERQQAGELFASGVGSYRNPTGNVVTFPINSEASFNQGASTSNEPIEGSTNQTENDQDSNGNNDRDDQAN